MRSLPQDLRLRKALLYLHLWTGLIAAVFLLILGVTGALLAFKDEIHHALNAKFACRSEITAADVRRDYPEAPRAVSRPENRCVRTSAASRSLAAGSSNRRQRRRPAALRESVHG